MLNAHEARDKTLESINEDIENEWIMIKSLIDYAIQNGEFYVAYNGTLNLTTRIRLEELGYKVIYNQQYDVPRYIIGWK